VVSEKPLPGVNEQAPAVASSEIEIAADAQLVWEVLTDFEGWPRWNADVESLTMQGPVAEGSTFRWKAGPGTITSTIRRLEPPRLIAWTGRTFGIRAVHFYRLEPHDGTTFVRTEESFEGLPARLLRRSLQRTLDRTLEGGLRSLRAEVERRARG
jgi:uncharacterized protein YndB with AHSA1/START domain